MYVIHRDEFESPSPPVILIKPFILKGFFFFWLAQYAIWYAISVWLQLDDIEQDWTISHFPIFFYLDNEYSILCLKVAPRTRDFNCPPFVNSFQRPIFVTIPMVVFFFLIIRETLLSENPQFSTSMFLKKCLNSFGSIEQS